MMGREIIKERRQYTVRLPNDGYPLKEEVLADFFEYKDNGDAVFYIQDSECGLPTIVAAYKNYISINCYELQKHLLGQGVDL